MKPLQDQVGIGKVWEAIDEQGNVKKDNLRGDILDIFSQLESELSSK
jgi:hypothetical protein